MLRPNNNQLYSYYVSLLIPTEYLQYLWIKTYNSPFLLNICPSCHGRPFGLKSMLIFKVPGWCLHLILNQVSMALCLWFIWPLWHSFNFVQKWWCGQFVVYVSLLPSMSVEYVQKQWKWNEVMSRFCWKIFEHLMVHLSQTRLRKRWNFLRVHYLILVEHNWYTESGLISKINVP